MTNQTHWVDRYISPLALSLGLVCCAVLSVLEEHTFIQALWYFTATLLTGVAFVLVSRFRNRSSFLWFALASVASNGTWFLERSALSSAQAPMLFILLAVCAMLAGRTYAVKIAQHIEHRYKLVANIDSTEKRYHMQRFVVEATPGWYILGGILLLYIFALSVVSQHMAQTAFIAVMLGFFQNVIYTQKSRLSQRGKNNPHTVIPTALLGVLGGIWFFGSFAYLARHHMAMYLWIPYVVTTVFGSTVGMWLSMKWELAMNIGGNDHLRSKTSAPSGNATHVARKERLVYGVLLSIGLLWVAVQEVTASLLEIRLAPLSFPWWESDNMPRLFTLLAMAITMFAQELSHTLVQSSGNRDHVRYHAMTIILWASTGFLVARMVLENPTWDIVPVAVMGSTLGFLFGRSLSGRIETYLVARMD